MDIPSQLPQFITAARPGALQTLALQAGQVIDAKIVGAAPNGGTQVEIRGQLLNLVLPTLVQAGDTIKLEVQGAGQQLRLALQQATASASPATPAPVARGPAITMPLPAPTATAPAAPPSATLPLQAHTSGAQATGVPAPSVQATPTVAPVALPATANGATAGPTPAGAATTPTTAAGQQTVSSAPQVAALSTAASPALAGAPVMNSVTTPPPASIYPQTASPALPNPQATAVSATAAVPAAPPAATVVTGAVRPVVATIATGSATTHPSSGNPLPQPATPQAALAQMVQAAIPRQGSVTALTAALVTIAGKVVLPEPVARAAQQVLAGRVAIDGTRFDGPTLQAAMRGSGIFQEASLVQGKLLPQADMKTALLALRQTLTTWLGQQAPVAAVAPIPPPLRGSTPRSRAGEAAAPLDPDAAPEQVGKQLLERTESALARVRLHQHASLPDSVAKTADWSMDLPVMVGTQQSLLQLQIHRDQQNESEAEGERGWQMRFALSLTGMGEVGAQVTLRAGNTGVMLWATEPAASAALEAEVASLRDTMISAGLRPGAVIVRHGAPPAQATLAPSGHFVDARS